MASYENDFHIVKVQRPMKMPTYHIFKRESRAAIFMKRNHKYIVEKKTVCWLTLPESKQVNLD